jgi:hypothetical protein
MVELESRDSSWGREVSRSAPSTCPVEMDLSEYDQAARLANEATAEVVAHYLHNAMIEREELQKENCIR